MVQIHASISQELRDAVIEVAKSQRRSVANFVGLLIEKGWEELKKEDYNEHSQEDL